MYSYLLDSSGGWAGLLEELDMEVKRLPRRNLGRDDRSDVYSCSSSGSVHVCTCSLILSLSSSVSFQYCMWLRVSGWVGVWVG